MQMFVNMQNKIIQSTTEAPEEFKEICMRAMQPSPCKWQMRTLGLWSSLPWPVDRHYLFIFFFFSHFTWFLLCFFFPFKLLVQVKLEKF